MASSVINHLIRGNTGAEVHELKKEIRRLKAELHTAKDGRIAMKLANRDFQDQNDTFLHRYNEACSDLSDLKAELEQLKQGHRENKQARNKLVNERDELQQACHDAREATQQAKIEADEARKELALYKRQCGRLTQTSQEHSHALQNAKDEADRARKELTSYKTNLSLASRVESQVTDDEVRSKMDQIFYSIQDFAVTASRGVTFGQWLSHCDICVCQHD